jgi:hypothetical protein
MPKQLIHLCVATAAIPLLFCGCAASTQNVAGTSSHVAIPSSQVVGKPPVSESGERATVIVKRDPGLYGSALDATLTIDGRDIAHVKAGQYYRFAIGPGEHLFGVHPTGGLGKLLADVHREVAVQVVAGQTYVLRLSAERGSGMHIQRSSM